MSKLLACPFCRELFAAGEAKSCPSCDVALRPMHELPPSLEAQAEAVARGEHLEPPEHRRLPPTYLGRGRGALLLLSVLGLAAFFQPWVAMSRPELMDLSGFDLARGRAGFLWAGAVAWFILMPLVWTRRSIARMRGVRIISALFAAVTLSEVLMLVLMAPRGHGYQRVAYEFGWGLYASAALSALGVWFGARFGGRIEDVPALPWVDRKARHETSNGEVLH